MFSTTNDSSSGERLASVVAVCIAAVCYAHNQLLYSLYFFYQVASYLFPATFPPVR
jgi:hypothetical protein